MRTSWILPPLLSLPLIGCASTAPLRTGSLPEVRTVTSIGDKPLAVVAGESGAKALAEDTPLAKGSNPQRQVSGRVVDTDGLPVSNAEVRLAINGTAAGRAVSVWTDEAGRFTLNNLRGGSSVTLVAEHADGRGGGLTGRTRTRVPQSDVEIALIEPGRSAGSMNGDESEPAEGRAGRVRGVSRAVEGELPEDELEALPPRPERSRRARVNPDDVPLPEDAETLLEPAGEVAESDEAPEPLAVSGRPGWRRVPQAGDAAEGGGQGGDSQSVPEDEPDQIPSDERRATQTPLGPESSEAEPFEQGTVEPPLPVTAGAASTVPSLTTPSAAPEMQPLAAPHTPAPPPDAPEPTPAFGAPVKAAGDEALIDQALGGANDPSHASGEPTSSLVPAMEPTARPAPAAPEVSATSDASALEESPAPEPDSSPLPPVSEAEVPAPGAGPSADGASAGASRPDLVEPRTEVPVEPPIAADPAGSPDQPPELSESAGTGESSPIEPPPPLEELPSPAGGASEGGSEGEEVLPSEPVEPSEPAAASASAPARRWTWGELSATIAAKETVIPNPPPLAGRAGESTDVGAGGMIADPALVRARCEFDTRKRQIVDFELPDASGRPVRFRDLDADYVLLDFWGSWCGPCVKAIPHLVDLQKRYGPGRLQVVGIAYETGEVGDQVSAVQGMQRRLGINYPLLLGGADGTPCPLQRAMNVKAYPTMVLLDRHGRILWRDQGASPTSLTRLDKVIASNVGGDTGVRRR